MDYDDQYSDLVHPDTSDTMYQNDHVMYQDDQIDHERLSQILHDEEHTEEEWEIVYNIINLPDMTDEFRRLLCILCNDEELVGNMIRNCNLLRTMYTISELQIRHMLELLTAGEEDGSKLSSILYQPSICKYNF